MGAMVYFIGAGPGDVELLTLKARRFIERADVILYAGSLINPAILAFARPDSEKLDTAHMRLEEQIRKMISSVRKGKIVARLHTGDPSIFGALVEQTNALAAAEIPYQIVPGVSSAFAAAATLGLEYTLPELTQTVIFTRMSGRTPVPPLENLRSLAAHRSSLVIFLSAGLLREVTSELGAAGYPPETPMALVYRASWPDEYIIRSTLADIAGLTEHQELTHQGLLIVSPALGRVAPPASHLYSGFQDSPLKRTGIAILTLTAPAANLGRLLLSHLPDAVLYLPRRVSCEQDSVHPKIYKFQESIRQVLQNAFTQYEFLVCIMASGIVVRELAPLLKNKHSDPAVVVMDPKGQFVVSLLSGHEGGANWLTQKIAKITGGQAVITTASDHQNIPALDVLAKESGWVLHPQSQLAVVMAALVNGEPVVLVADDDLALPAEILDYPWAEKCNHWKDAQSRGGQQQLVLTYRRLPETFWLSAPRSVVYYLPALVLGVGCNRGASDVEILTAIQTTLEKAGLALQSVTCVATISQKAEEPGLVEACRRMNWQLQIFDCEQIRKVENLPNPSEHVLRAMGIWGVAEPAARLASESDSLLVGKQKFANVTVAVALRQKEPS